MASPCARRARISPGRLAHRRAPRAIDEYRPLQPRQRGDERPGADLLLGDERNRRDGRQHGNIEPCGVIGDEQHRPIAHDRAVEVDADAEQAADLAVVPIGERYARRSGSTRSNSACTGISGTVSAKKPARTAPPRNAPMRSAAARVTLSSPASRARRKARADGRRA